MRRLSRAVLLTLLAPVFAAAAEPSINVELNGGETAEGKCRLTFVVENKGTAPIESLKLDLVVFNRENRVSRRLLAEMGPVRIAKTIVKIYSVDGECAEIRSVLINDVTACTPGKRDDCLDELALSSRMEGVRFFK